MKEIQYACAHSYASVWAYQINRNCSVKGYIFYSTDVTASMAACRTFLHVCMIAHSAHLSPKVWLWMNLMDLSRKNFLSFCWECFLNSVLLRCVAASLDNFPKDIAVYSFGKFETTDPPIRRHIPEGVSPRLHLPKIQVPTPYPTGTYRVNSAFDICLTVHHWYKCYKHQLDATVTVY